LTNDGFEALPFEAERPFEADKFQRFLERLSDGVFRAKGILWIAESEKPHVSPSSANGSHGTKAGGSGR
jgi:G3E family GTPase